MNALGQFDVPHPHRSAGALNRRTPRGGASPRGPLPSCFIARSQQSIRIENKDGITHNFTITGTQVNVDVQAGQTFNGQSAGLAPGTYQFVCRFHQSLGMKGTAVVR